MRLVALLVALLICSASVASQPYPSKPIRLIVPTAPGGGTDFLARVLAQSLGPALGQTIVVDNRGGAGTTLGAAVAAKSPPDGYTLLLHHTSLAFNATFYRRLPYDAIKDFSPVSLLATQPFLLVVHPALPVRSVKDLITLARAHPGDRTSAGSLQATDSTRYTAPRMRSRT